MDAFGYVLASRRLVEERLPVLFMYRETPSGADSGWRFFSGLEDQAYVDDPANIAIYDVRTILDVDRSVAPYLSAGPGSALEREDEFQPFRFADDFGFAPEEGAP